MSTVDGMIAFLKIKLSCFESRIVIDGHSLTEENGKSQDNFLGFKIAYNRRPLKYTITTEINVIY